MKNTTTTITSAQYQTLQNYINNNDRVGFYIALYEMTGNDTVWVMSQISSQSDIPGVVAWLMNGLYADWVDGYPPDGVEYFSDRVAWDAFDSIQPDDNGFYTVPSEIDMLQGAHDTWVERTARDLCLTQSLGSVGRPKKNRINQHAK